MLVPKGEAAYEVMVDDATTLIIEGPDAPGLLGAITSTLSASSCSIITFSGETLKNGKIRDRFVVQVNGKPLEAGVRAERASAPASMNLRCSIRPAMVLTGQLIAY